MAATVAMASRILGTASFPEELKAMPLRSRGAPFLSEEVVKTLLDIGALQRETAGTASCKTSPKHVCPTPCRASLWRAWTGWGRGQRTVHLASVIGRQFLVRLLERIADLTGQLEGLLTEETLELIYRQGPLPDPVYVFKHAMIQDAAYNSLLLRQRLEIASGRGRGPGLSLPERLAEHYEELAHHFTQGEEWEKAMHTALGRRSGRGRFCQCRSPGALRPCLASGGAGSPRPGSQEPGAPVR